MELASLPVGLRDRAAHIINLKKKVAGSCVGLTQGNKKYMQSISMLKDQKRDK